MSLHEKQQELYDFITSHQSGQILLNAPGGTGKTHFVKYLMANRKSLKNITVLAPTHKAKSLFIAEKIPCFTIHKFLKSEKTIDEETGEILFKFNLNDDFKSNSDSQGLLIVDECSMISVEMFKILNKVKYVLYCGDERQIPPVSEKFSPVFNKCDRVFTFTKNYRLSNNPDSFSAHWLKKFCSQVDNPNTKIFVEDKEPIEGAIESFVKDKDAVVLTWTNKNVTLLNNTIRRGIYGKNSDELEKYYESEKLIFSGYRQTETETYHSSSFVFVEKVEECKEFISYVRCSHQKNIEKLVRCEKCDIVGHRKLGFNITFYKITDTNKVIWLKPKSSVDEKSFAKILAHYKKHCLKVKDKVTWGKFYDFKDTWNSDLYYSYAMTVHKAQGSQWDNVYVDINNIRLCRDLELSARLSYTAVSRFRKRLMFI